MHLKQLYTIRRLNRLLLNGYDLNHLPGFTTNDGYKLDYTDSDVPGKVGLVLTKGYDYALLVGDLVDGVLLNVITESNTPAMLDVFHKQMDIFINRVREKVPPYKLEYAVAAEKHRLANNNMLENAFATKGVVDRSYQLTAESHLFTMEFRRDRQGNGLLAGKAKNGVYFYVQFSRGMVTSFNSNGIPRKYIVDNFFALVEGYSDGTLHRCAA